MNIYEETHLVGGPTADYWNRDPKRLGFVLARYKFVARMFAGKATVLEVGCADGFGAHVVRQFVTRLVAIDIDERAIAEAEQYQSEERRIEFKACDFLTVDYLSGFSAAYSLDVLEHMTPGKQERAFLTRMREAAPLAIIGSPSLESQPYASELSRRGHVNCKTEDDFRAMLLRYWREVFVFGMNDEVLHTGFGPMCHYRLGLCVA